MRAPSELPLLGWGGSGACAPHFQKRLKHKGCHTVVMRGRPCREYVYIDAEVATTKRQLDYWVHLALDYNGS